MPERWETELRKLRRIDAPADLEGRIAEGPRSEPRRRPGERLAAGFVAFAVCAALIAVGISVSDHGGRRASSDAAMPADDRPLVLELRSGTNGPDATLGYAGQTQDVVIAGSDWCPSEGGECSSMIADFATYPPSTAFTVAPGRTPITVEGDGAIASVEVLDPSGDRLKALDGTTTPADDGRYVFSVSARYPEGSASLFFGIQTLNDAASAPDELGVDCSMGFVQTDTSVVQTQPDGLHVRFDGGDAVSGFEIVDPTSSRDVAAVGGDGDLAFGIDPGDWGIGCGRGVSPADTVPFVLIDPVGHHAPEELTCGDRVPTPFVSPIPTTRPHAEAAYVLVTGLAPGDQVRGAGYGADTWRLGPTYVVVRDGVAVARIVLGEQDGVWTGTFAACEGSEVSLSSLANAATTGTATGGSGAAVSAAIRDVLALRCEGLGPAVDNTQVRVQTDGLHVNAENVADADFVIVESDDGSVGSAVEDFAAATMPLVFDIEHGVYWIGCRTYDENGSLEGSHLDHPEAYVRIDVLPA
jgi:hypothetical protein